jgi:V/A-type H+-transporting ATPase subunit D
MILDVNPTRMELLRLKKRIVLARRGHKLLKDKQDELVRQFLGIIEETKRLRTEADRESLSVYQSWSVAEGILGTGTLAGLFRMPGARTTVRFSTKTIMSVKVPSLEADVEGDPLEYGAAQSSMLLDRCVGKYRRLLDTLLKLAELEKTSILLAEEIEKTRRRVNALEYILIPNIADTIRYITMKLAEMERSNLTRVMKVKAMIEAKQGET